MKDSIPQTKRAKNNIESVLIMLNQIGGNSPFDLTNLSNRVLLCVKPLKLKKRKKKKTKKRKNK